MELIFEEVQPELEFSRWNKLVPIVETNGVVYAYMMNEVYEVNEYNELCHTLEHTTAKEVKLVLNNGGGLLDSMLTIRNSIAKSKAKITAVLSGTVASSATMIALACDELEIAPGTSWLTHYYSGGLVGKGNEIEAKYEFEKVQIPKLFKEIHKGFLTNEEIAEVIKGNDMWMNSEEILKRFNSMKGK